MKKGKLLLILAVAVVLTVAPTAWRLPQTAAPVSSSAVSVVSKPPLPWGEVTAETVPSYAEYFAQVIDYKTTDWLYAPDPPTARKNVWPQTVYGWRWYDGALYLLDPESGQEPLCLQTGIDLGKDFIHAGSDYQFVYGIRGGTDLIRMDYYGEQLETLFRDPTGRISAGSAEQSEAWEVLKGNTFRSTDQIQMADGKVLFFLAGSSSGTGGSVWRLYLPDGTLDELVSGLPENARFLAPVSNWEVLWELPNPEYEETYQRIRTDPENPFLPEAEDERAAHEAFEQQYRIHPTTVYYSNALTGQQAATGGPGCWLGIQRHGDDDAIEANGHAWWKDILDSCARPLPDFYRRYILTQDPAILQSPDNDLLLQGLEVSDGAYTTALVSEFLRRLVADPQGILAFVQTLPAETRQELLFLLCGDIAYYPDSAEKQALRAYLTQQTQSPVVQALLAAWPEP